MQLFTFNVTLLKPSTNILTTKEHYLSSDNGPQLWKPKNLIIEFVRFTETCSDLKNNWNLLRV